MTNPKEIDIRKDRTCPICGGTGKDSHLNGFPSFGDDMDLLMKQSCVTCIGKGKI